MFVASLVTWLLCRSLERPPVKDASQQHNSDFMEAGKQVSVDAPVGLTMKVVVKPVILIQYTFWSMSVDCSPLSSSYAFYVCTQKSIIHSPAIHYSSQSVSAVRKGAQISTPFHQNHGLYLTYGYISPMSGLTIILFKLYPQELHVSTPNVWQCRVMFGCKWFYMRWKRVTVYCLNLCIPAK